MNKLIVIAAMLFVAVTASAQSQGDRQAAAEEKCGDLQRTLATKVSKYCETLPKSKYQDCMEFGSKETYELTRSCFRGMGATMPSWW